MFVVPYPSISCTEGSSPPHAPHEQQHPDNGDPLFRRSMSGIPYSVVPSVALPPLPSFTTALDPIISSQPYQTIDALSSVSSTDGSDIYSPTSPPKINPFPSTHSSTPEANKSSNGSRLEIILNAAPAMLNSSQEPPLAYLNKGQSYNIQIQDRSKTDGKISTTLLIMFHEEAHRAVASNYWSFWQSQQKDPQQARAVDIDVHRCNGVQNITWSAFDRISFEWDGKRGANITVRFNCLSTDFSRIKGVKGIPLRLCMESKMQDMIEGVYCRIKLFRDKGAERKNKDDARHIERRLAKINSTKDNHPLWLAYNRTQTYTVFTALVETSSDSANSTTNSPPQSCPSSFSPPPSSSPCTSTASTLSLYQTTAPFPSTPASASLISCCPMTDTVPTHCSGVKRSRASSSPSTSLSFTTETSFHSQRLPFKVIGLDPSYIPNRKRRIAKLRLFIRLASDGDLHHAVYLEHLTVQDLVDKVTTKLNLVGTVKQTVRHIVRDVKTISLLVDDEVVQHIPDEQIIQVETIAEQDSSLTLVLRY